jgi:multidrug efflux pump subunit AcrA (membrane-fusion protein)
MTTAHVNYIPGAFSVKFSSDIKNNRLFPGMKAKVKVTAAEYEDVITIPNNLIEGNSVWVMAGKKKQKKTVKKGPTNGKMTVILKGLKEGDKVISK